MRSSLVALVALLLLQELSVRETHGEVTTPTTRNVASFATQQTKVGAPVTLFAPPVAITVSDGFTGPPYVVSTDAQRFLIPAWMDVKSPITVIRNWKP